MTIAFPNNLPNPSELTMGIEYNVQSTESPFTGARQTHEILGAKWKLSMTWEVITREQVPLFRAFLARLKGGAVPFYYADPSQTEPQGTISTNATIIAANTFDTIDIATSQNSETIFQAGDYIEIPVVGGENELKMILDDVVTDGSGFATVTFSPEMRKTVDVGADIIYQNPVGAFISDDKINPANISAPYHGESFTINATELML